MDKNKLMKEFARKAHETGVFTGTWLYAENGEIISSGAVGYRDPQDSLPVRQDSVFDMASVSKQFTAAAVMLLRCRGLLRLEDEIRYRIVAQRPSGRIAEVKDGGALFA